ncbi:MAG: hypothetical protein SGPRY_003432 [Prymnesium sp.]
MWLERIPPSFMISQAHCEALMANRGGAGRGEAAPVASASPFTPDFQAPPCDTTSADGKFVPSTPTRRLKDALTAANLRMVAPSKAASASLTSRSSLAADPRAHEVSPGESLDAGARTHCEVHRLAPGAIQLSSSVGSASSLTFFFPSSPALPLGVPFLTSTRRTPRSALSTDKLSSFMIDGDFLAQDITDPFAGQSHPYRHALRFSRKITPSGEDLGIGGPVNSPVPNGVALLVHGGRLLHQPEVEQGRGADLVVDGTYAPEPGFIRHKGWKLKESLPSCLVLTTAVDLEPRDTLQWDYPIRGASSRRSSALSLLPRSSPSPIGNNSSEPPPPLLPGMQVCNCNTYDETVQCVEVYSSRISEAAVPKDSSPKGEAGGRILYEPFLIASLRVLFWKHLAASSSTLSGVAPSSSLHGRLRLVSDRRCYSLLDHLVRMDWRGRRLR